MLLSVMTSLSIALPANAFHGEAITINSSEDVEVVIAFDPEDANTRGYITSPYGFTKDALDTFVSNSEALAGVTESVTIFLDFDSEGGLLYTASRKIGDEWVAEEQRSYGRPADANFIQEVICDELLSIDCSSEQTALELAFDQTQLLDVPNQPFITVGSFPLSSSTSLNVYIDQLSLDQAVSFQERAENVADVPGDLKLLGDTGEAIDFLVQRKITASIERDSDLDPLPENDVPAVPFEEEGSLDSKFDVAPGFDPRLRYITIHCTGPGVMSASQIRNYVTQGRRNKGHGYIMLDGSYISVASISENPNRTYATKTETCLRSEAFGTMFNIELNYDCHWRPSKTGSPSEAMLDRLADVINWTHQNIGPLSIISHTYVDMGLVDGHTDPQDKPGFNWQSLYERIEARGGDLDGIEVIDPAFAAAWPISRTDRAHQFPPILTGTLPTGRDECRNHASQ